MHKLHKTSTLILATILLSTSLLSSCSSPAKKQDRHETSVPAKASAPFDQNTYGKNISTFQIDHFLKLCQENINYSDLCSQAVPVNAFIKNLPQKPNNLSFEEFYQAYKAFNETEKPGRKISEIELRTEATRMFDKIYDYNPIVILILGLIKLILGLIKLILGLIMLILAMMLQVLFLPMCISAFSFFLRGGNSEATEEDYARNRRRVRK